MVIGTKKGEVEGNPSPFFVLVFFVVFLNQNRENMMLFPEGCPECLAK